MKMKKKTNHIKQLENNVFQWRIVMIRLFVSDLNLGFVKSVREMYGFY